MNTSKNILNGIEFLVGAFFIWNMASDIQLGFGLLMIFDALRGWIK